MAFFKSLFNKIIPNRRQPDETQPDDHYVTLESLRTKHQWIDVIVTKTDTAYQSLILKIDIEQRELIIDELYPPEGLEHLETGDTLEVSSKEPNQVKFYTRILAFDQREDATYYQLELPDEVGQRQNRGVFRVYVDNESGLDATLVYKNTPLRNVRIINLSVEGLKLSFDDDIINESTDKDTSDQLLHNCILQLPTGDDIDCDIELRKLYRIHAPQPHTLSGGKLTISNPQHRVKLQQYLAAVQRKQRRREMRIN